RMAQKRQRKPALERSEGNPPDSLLAKEVDLGNNLSGGFFASGSAKSGAERPFDFAQGRLSLRMTIGGH
ncbi:MAG: hypothetical protein WEC37_03245, partial [Anaerolineales bacterium]